ncbi:hypothetical protein AV530_019718 [Patagioenas fasciata monilis]|uniref:Uncharacterized protein n=1 Tax=Patagioenas fasciata monilis TaxID=372326 RepID=A0A1V4JV76_PATFA|nr:hypothetical protein AV530_019718 [Patagioenas fasciata monilis]
MNEGATGAGGGQGSPQTHPTVSCCSRNNNQSNEMAGIRRKKTYQECKKRTRYRHQPDGSDSTDSRLPLRKCLTLCRKARGAETTTKQQPGNVSDSPGSAPVDDESCTGTQPHCRRVQSQVETSSSRLLCKAGRSSNAWERRGEEVKCNRLPILCCH